MNNENNLDINKNLHAHLETLSLTPMARQYVNHVLQSDPAQSADKPATTNVAGSFSSPSQRLSIPYDNRSGELAQILRWEMDSDVIAYRDHPPPINLTDPLALESIDDGQYYPDFLVVKRKSVEVVCVRMGNVLRRSKKKRPEQWSINDNVWTYKPVATAFSKIGLLHSVRSSDDFGKRESSNIKTLISVVRDSSDIDPVERRSIKKIMRKNAWITIAELKREAGLSNYDTVFRMIVACELYADLKQQLLSQAKACLVSGDSGLLDMAIESLAPIQDWSITSSDVNSIPTRKDAVIALDRLALVNSGKSSRTIRRYKSKIKEGADKGINQFTSLLPGRRGNRSDRVPPSVRKAINDHINTHYLLPTRPPVLSAYLQYRSEASVLHAGYDPVSRPTYKAAIDQIDVRHIAARRAGRRGSNASTRSTDVHDREITAVRPFERACVDHQQIDVLAIITESQGMGYCQRPFLTLLSDEFSSCIIGVWLSFSAPSRSALSMLMRQSVREHGRLPECVHSDRGAELRSVDFQQFIAHYGMSMDWSPPAHARYNALVEGHFSTLTSQWSRNRPGNVVDFKNQRDISKGFRPHDHAAMSLENMFQELVDYQSHFNSSVLGNEAFSPLQQLETGLNEFPSSGIAADVDDEFRLASGITVKKGDLKVSRNGDIANNGIRYSHPLLRRHLIKKSRVEARRDPENPYLIYCNINGNWISALSGEVAKFESEREMDRWISSVRVSDGRAARDFAKQAANEKLISKLNAQNSTAPEQEDSTATHANHAQSSSDQVSKDVDDIFNALRNVSLDGLDSHSTFTTSESK